MSEKVKIPREVAKAIGDLRDKFMWSDNNLLDFKYIEVVAVSEEILTIRDHIKKVGRAEYAKAIINGYEVEETAEEQLKEYYRKYNLHPHNEYRLGVLDGIRKSLAILIEKYPELKGILD